MASDLARLMGIDGSFVIEWIDSPALRDNPLGDPSERGIGVYLPPGYDPQGSQRYPVLYCLHGYTGDLGALVATRKWETNVVQWIDRLIRDGTMAPAILAVVDGWTRLGGSQYVDSIHNGGYATYVVRDVVGHMDATFRTVAHEGGRAVLGKSSGGFGAMHLVLTRPGTFAAFASHSGDSHFRMCQIGSLMSAFRTLSGGRTFESFVVEFEGKQKRAQHEYATIEMLGYGAAYSPAGAQAFAIDLPIDLATGELRDDVFGRWLAFDPAEVVPEKRAELERLRLRYLDCGRKDEYGLDIGARVIAKRIRDLGLTVRHEEFDDDHRNVGYRYAISLPALAEVLDRE